MPSVSRLLFEYVNALLQTLLSVRVDCIAVCISGGCLASIKVMLSREEVV